MKKVITKILNASEKSIYRVLLIIFICSMIPVWYLGRYAVPSLDDFYFGIKPHHAWLQNPSIGSLFTGAIDMVKFYYEVKQATYTSIFLMALMPGVVNEKFYFVTPIILSSMFIASISVLVHVLLKDCLGIKNKYIVGIANLLLIFVAFQNILIPLEAIYWYNGGTHYVFMQSVLYFEIATILHFLNSEKKNIGMIILACFLGFVVGGGNLISGLQACILGAICVLLFILQIQVDKKNNKFLTNIGIGGYDKKNWLVVIPIVVTIIAYAINALAPCNSIRAQVEVQMNPIKAVINSFYWAVVYFFDWITPMSIVMFACIAIIVWKQLENTNKRFLNPWIFGLISYCLFSAMFTPTWYAMSSDPPNRVKNIIGTARYIFVFINIINDCGYARKNKKSDNTLTKILAQTEKEFLRIVVIGSLLIGMFFVFEANKNTYVSISATRSILNGEAARYYDQNMERFKIYNDQSKPDVVIKHLTEDAKPYLLFKEDINDENGEEGYWQNVEISEYYDKTSIKVID